MNEKFDRSSLDLIIANYDRFGLLEPEMLRTNLMKYAAEVIDGTVNVEYHSRSGRQFVKNGIGLQSMKGIIRNTIAGRYYQDIDMTNAHPVILQHISTVPTPKLNNYIANREELIKGDRAGLKKLFLILTNSDNPDLSGLTKFQIAYAEEMMIIREALVTRDREAYEAHTRMRKKTTNPKSSYVNKLMCMMENRILMCMRDFIKSPYHVLCFDGIMVDKSTPVDISALKAHVTETLGINMDFKIKPMTPTLDLTGLELAPGHAIKGAEWIEHFPEDFADRRHSITRRINSADFAWGLNAPCTLVNSPMDSGKTYQMVKNIGQFADQRILSLFHRKSLCQQSVDKFNTVDGINMRHYLDKDHCSPGFALDDHLAIVINSLFKIDMSKPEHLFNVIIIDECESVLNTIYGGVIKDPVCVQTFEQLIRAASNVILLDANPGAHTRCFIDHFKLKSQMRIVSNRFNSTKFKCKVVDSLCDLDATHTKLLREGKKVAYVSNSAVDCAARHRTCKTAFPDKNSLLITSADTDRAEIDRFCLEPNKVTAEYDSLYLSPVIESGVSIEAPIDCIVINVSAHSSAPMNVSQQIGRFRNAAEAVIYVQPTKNEPRSLKAIETQDFKSQFTARTRGFIIPSNSNENGTISMHTSSLSYKMGLISRYTDELQRATFQDHVIMYLRRSGIECYRSNKAPASREKQKAFRKADKEARLAVRKTRQTRIVTSEGIPADAADMNIDSLAEKDADVIRWACKTHGIDPEAFDKMADADKLEVADVMADRHVLREISNGERILGQVPEGPLSEFQFTVVRKTVDKNEIVVRAARELLKTCGLEIGMPAIDVSESLEKFRESLTIGDRYESVARAAGCKQISRLKNFKTRNTKQMLAFVNAYVLGKCNLKLRRPKKNTPKYGLYYKHTPLGKQPEFIKYGGPLYPLP